MSNTLVRVIVGIIGIPLIILILIFGHYYFMLFCVVISFFCMNEFYNLFEEPVNKTTWFGAWLGGISVHKAVFLIISSLIVVFFYFEHFNFVLILYFIMFIYLIIDEVIKSVRHLEAIATWMLSVVYISTPFGLLSLMSSENVINVFGMNYALICLILVWISDTMSFFGGKLLGKHKLAAKISPKKTIEGSLSGLIFTIIASISIYYLYPVSNSLLHFIVLGLLAGLFAQLGDLFESYLKRSVNVKDSSNIIPGHGGVLDRFDSILFVAPAVYIFMYLISIY